MYKFFKKPVLNEATVAKNPFLQFEKWYREAHRILGEEANTMTLATSANNQPNARIVYLRGNDKKSLPVGKQKFWFFTNYRGQKAIELKKNNKACLLFFWPRMDRQVRIQGTVEKLSSKDSDTYFASRERGSQIGAWASPQSEVIYGRKELENLVEKYTSLFEGKTIPRPSHWGGYRLIPSSFEFWQGQENRLHDRIFFSRLPSLSAKEVGQGKQKNSKWKTERLSP